MKECIVVGICREVGARSKKVCIENDDLNANNYLKRMNQERSPIYRAWLCVGGESVMSYCAAECL